MRRSRQTALACLGALFVFGSGREPSPPPPHAARALAAAAVKATLAADDERLAASGTLRSEEEVRVITPFPGTVKELFFAEGDLVRAGITVATIDSPDLLAQVNSAQEAVEKAQIAQRAAEERLANAEKQLAEKTEFYRRDLIARREVEEAERVAATLRAEKELARAQLSQADAALRQAHFQLRRTRIDAPASGVVTRVFARPGEYAGTAGTLLTIGRLETLLVSLDLAETEAARLQPLMTARIVSISVPKRIFRGAVTGIAPSRTGTARKAVDVRVENPGGALKPGMKVEVSFTIGDGR
jgi:RND family efflux transporter MFP subunit